MKKYIILCSAIFTLLAGCSEKLEIQPTQSVDENLVFTSDANIKAALNGAYDVASGGALLGGDLQLYSELLGADGEISWVGTYNQPDEIFNKEILTNNSYVRDSYLEGYRLINICNNIIASIDIVNEADRNTVKGQALFLRGLMYFELVKLYAKPYSAGSPATSMGLQIITTPTLNGQVTEANKVPRSSLQDTYNQILADLTAAKPIIGGSRGVTASSYAVAGVLSRVYLVMENYAGARDEANYVIQSSGATLENSYSKLFNNTSPSSEDILVLPITAQDGTNDLHLFWSILDYGARDGDVEVNESHIDLYQTEDQRLDLFYIDGNDIYRSGKWQLQYKYLPLIRLGEMYLTRAEANFRLGTSVGASPAADLVTIRTKRSIDPSNPGLTLPVLPATLANIIAERHREIAHEGQRIHDIKRLKQSVDGFSYDANELVLPIPLREINASGGILIQNPGY